MRRTIKVKSSELAIQFQRIRESLNIAVDEALMLQGFVDMAKIFCPVDTGTLESSIRAVHVNQYASRIVAGGAEYINPKTGKSVDYAGYVHEGTSVMPARPFILRALEREKVAWTKKILKETLERL